MKNLTRSSLSSGDYLGALGLPKDILWSKEAIEQSLAATLLTRPPGELWVFAYGSLMWNPLLNFEQRQVAVLHGWHRSFCLRMSAGRGSPDKPGRMLAVEPGGVTCGIALRLHEDHLAEELRVLWTREMVTGAYQPVWVPIVLAEGREASAITFVADASRPQYESDASISTVAPIVAEAAGLFGTNADYVFNLDFALADCGMNDEYVEALVNELKSRVLIQAESPGQCQSRITK